MSSVPNGSSCYLVRSKEKTKQKIRSKVKGLKEEHLAKDVFSFFEREITGWLEELEAVLRNMEEQLAAKEKADSLAKLFRALSGLGGMCNSD